MEMKYYKLTDEPIRLHGLNHIDTDKGEYWRLTPDIMGKMPHYCDAGKTAMGGRLRFCTDSPKLIIQYSLRTERVDRAMALPASAGMDVYLGSGKDSRYAGFAAPSEYGFKNNLIESEIVKGPSMETVTINLPRGEVISSLQIGVEHGAAMEPAPEYKISRPIIFYGSSITEGGCAPRPGTAYTSIVPRWMDADYYNYGFSGKAKGEPEFAYFIAAHKNISAFVMDYDHNAPTPEHLESTHKPFFDIVRRAHPALPIVMMTRPDFDRDPDDSTKRRSIVYKTFQAAKSDGDENVYFVDGEQFFGPHGRAECTIDGCHPNALGFMGMANTVYPLLKRLVK